MNTGFLKFDMDIEMGDKNVFNTTGSQLWKKVVLLFDAELKQQYSLMRQDRFTVDNIMKYLYGEQISQIPAYYYNKDMQSKYLNFGSSYLYALHGSGEQHIRKWIRERLMYCDTLLGYRASSSDYITLRSSKLGEVYLDVETYIPMYLSIKWRDEANNTGLQTKRVGRGEKVRFTYNMPTATDQEIIVYAGHYLKSLGDVSNLQPTSMLIANADRLTEIECHSPNLINTDLSECTKLQRIDLSDCTALGTGIGAQPILNIQNCKYLRYCDCRNTQLTAIYTMQAGGNLEEIYYPQSTQVVQLTNQTYLHTVGLPSTNPCENLADVMITNCNAIKTLSSETIVLDFNTLKYVQNLNITNSLSGLNSMHFNGFDKLRNVTLSSLKELDTIGFEDMMPITTTSTLKNITISDCPLITSLSFNVSSDDYKVAFASGGKLDLGGLQSLKSIECNTSVKGLDTLIVPTSLTDLRFTTEYGDGINEIKNIWSASAVHNNDGFEGIDFQDMTIEFIDMLGLNGISNAINFHIAPKTQNPNLNTARDGSASKPWFHPIGSIDLSNYTGLMIGMLRGVDLNKLDVVINTDRDQVDLTSLFECATLPTAQNIVTKTNNILAKFPKSVIWDYMFKGCDLSFSPNDIRIPNRGLSLKGMYKDSNVTEDVSLPNVIMAVDEMFMNCIGITTYEKNWLKTYSKITYTVPTSNGTSGSWDDSGNYTEGTNYNQFLYTPSDGEKAFKIMTTGTGVVRINYFYNASFLSRIVYTPEFDSYPYVVTIPDGCNKVIFVCDKTIRFASEGTITTSNCYTNTGGALSEIPTSWGGYGLDKNVTSIYVIDTTHLTNTTTFNLVLNDNQVGITDWGDGVTNSEKSHTYAEHGTYTIKTKSWSNGTPSNDLKTALIEIKQIKLIGHNGNSKDYSNSFNGCSNLRKVTAYNLAPTDCGSMFNGCPSLTELVGLDTWDMSNCTGIGNMFYGTGITDPTPVYDMLSTFTDSSADSLFRESKIESIELGRFPNSIKNFSRIAWGCTNLKTIDFTNCVQDTTSWESAFRQVKGVTSMIGLETLNASDGVILENMFVGTDLSNVGTIDMSGMTCKIRSAPPFTGTKVTTIKMGFNWVNITNDLPNYMFYDFNTLENVEWGINLKSSFNDYTGLKNHNNLTLQSLLNLFNALYDFSTDGGTHTVIIGATNIAKLTREQMLIAIKKHWTIQGAPIQGVFRDTDISKLTSDNTVTAVAIELTADNYLTRIDEVLGVYTNAVDVYFFDDGSVTTLASMCYNNNTVTKDRIQNVTFIDGYFENCTSLIDAFRETKGLVTVTGIPDNATEITSAFFDASKLKSVSKIPSKCTRFNIAFRGCRSLVSVPTNGWTGNVEATFQYCSLLNQQINIVNPTVLGDIFNGCSALEISPTFTGTYTGKIDRLFKGCEKLTNIVLPTTWRPSSAQSTFIDCTQLVTIENLDALDMSNCTNVDSMFEGCKSIQDWSFYTNWNMPKLTNLDYMFKSSNIPEFNGITTGQLTGNINRNFSNCKSLTSINYNMDLSQTSGNFYIAYQNCINLQSVSFNGTNCNIVGLYYAFENCSSLTTIDFTSCTFTYSSDKNSYIMKLPNTLTTVTFSPNSINGEVGSFIFNAPNLTVASLLSLLNGLNDTTNNCILTIGSTNLAKLTDEQKMIAVNKCWKLEGYPIIKIASSVDLSSLTADTSITKAYIELTSDNVTTRISEVMTAYPSVTELYFYENGTVTTLEGLFTSLDNSIKSQFTKVVFMNDNFSNVSDMTDAIRSIDSLEEAPVAWGGFGFSKDKTVIAELTIPSDNYTITLGQCYVDNNAPYKGTWITSFGDGNYDYSDNSNTNNKISHTYEKAGTYILKTHRLLYQIDTPTRQAFTKIINAHKYLGEWGIIEHCIGFTNLIEADLSNLAGIQFNAKSMFKNCSKLVKVTAPNFTSTNCEYMFENCSSLTEIVGIDTWNMSNCTDCSSMFDGCSSLTEVTFTMTNYSNCNRMFHKAKKLINININLKPTDISDLLRECYSIAYIKSMDLSNATVNVNGIAWATVNNSLQTFNIISTIKCDMKSINGFKGLSVDGIMNIINNLYDFASEGNTDTHTVQLGETNLAKLTDEQIAIATNKGWTIS